MSNPTTFALLRSWRSFAVLLALAFILAVAWALAGPAQADESAKPARPSGQCISTQQGSLDVALS